MTEVTAEWLESQGAVYNEPWWCLRQVEVWLNNESQREPDDPTVIAVNEKCGEGRVENPTREQVLRMADGVLP